jgi:hypothetical protein
VADNVCPGLDQLRNLGGLDFEVDSVKGRIRWVARAVGNNEPIVLGERALGTPCSPTRKDAAVEEQDQRPTVARTIDIHAWSVISGDAGSFALVRVRELRTKHDKPRLEVEAPFRTGHFR